MSKFSKDFEKKITKSVQENLINLLEKRVVLLEETNKIKEEKNDMLTAIVINKNLNTLSEDR